MSPTAPSLVQFNVKQIKIIIYVYILEMKIYNTTKTQKDNNVKISLGFKIVLVLVNCYCSAKTKEQRSTILVTCGDVLLDYKSDFFLQYDSLLFPHVTVLHI